MASASSAAVGAAQGARFPQLDLPAVQAPPAPAVTEAVPASPAQASASADDAVSSGPSGLSCPSGKAGRESDAGPPVPRHPHGGLDQGGPSSGDQRGPTAGDVQSSWRPSGRLPAVPTGVLRLLGRRQQEGPGPPGGPAVGTREGIAGDEGTGPGVEGPSPLVRLLLQVREGPDFGPPVKVSLAPWVPAGTQDAAMLASPVPSRGTDPAAREVGPVVPQANADELGSQTASRGLGGYLSKAGAFAAGGGGLWGKQAEEGAQETPKRAWAVSGWFHLPGSTTLPKQDEGSSAAAACNASSLEPLPDQEPDATTSTRLPTPSLPEQDPGTTTGGRSSIQSLLPDQDPGPAASFGSAVPPCPGQDAESALQDALPAAPLPNQEITPLLSVTDSSPATASSGSSAGAHTALPHENRTATPAALERTPDGADVALWADSKDGGEGVTVTPGVVSSRDGTAQAGGPVVEVPGRPGSEHGGDFPQSRGNSRNVGVEDRQTSSVIACREDSQLAPTHSIAEGGAVARPGGLLETMGAVQQGLQTLAGRWMPVRAPGAAAGQGAETVPSSRQQALGTAGMPSSQPPDPVLPVQHAGSSAVAARFGNVAASEHSTSATPLRVQVEVGRDEMGEERCVVRLIVCPEEGTLAHGGKSDGSLMSVLHAPNVPAALAGLFRSLRRGSDSPSQPSAQRVEPLQEVRQGSTPSHQVAPWTSANFSTSVGGPNQEALNSRAGARGIETHPHGKSAEVWEELDRRAQAGMEGLMDERDNGSSAGLKSGTAGTSYGEKYVRPEDSELGRRASERSGLSRSELGDVKRGRGGTDETEGDEAHEREERRAIGLKLLKKLRRTAEEVCIYWRGC